jgi:PLD-like domain
VLTHDGAPVAVWTGSTNLTQGAIFGHLNVGHLVGDPAIATRFLDYWTQLADQQHTTAALRTWDEASNAVDTAAPPPGGLTAVFSPRSTRSRLLSWYADAFDAAVSSAHITGAFGLNKVFRDRLGVDRDVVRTVLLDQKPDPAIPAVDPDVRVSWGDYLHHVTFEQWAAEQLTGFNSWVKFIHTKIILIDPLTAAPVTLTGSANYSDNSTTDNEENTVVVRSDGSAAGSAAARRVADIYLTEYQRLFTHFVFRDWAAAASAGESTGVLVEDDTWTTRYYTPSGWRTRQRTTFAAPLP